MRATSKDTIYYREKTYAPWWVWLFAFLMCGSLAVAFGAALGVSIGWVTFVISGLPVAWAILTSAYLIEVDNSAIRVGRAELPLRFCGTTTALEPAAARERRGPKADPACYLVLRGWISTAVTIDVVDPADPTPYWFISTRHPEELVRAISKALGAL